MHGCDEKAFENPLKEALLTSIFIREKQLKYLQTSCIVMASLPDTDRNKLSKALKDYYGMLFPEDESAKDFERTASNKLRAWVGKSVELVPQGNKRFSLHLG